MPGFHWKGFPKVGTTVPIWLQVFLEIFAILDPEFAWLVPVIEAAYIIWQNLPWFHRVGALFELKSAVRSSKTAQATGAANPTQYIEAWSNLWKSHKN